MSSSSIDLTAALAPYREAITDNILTNARRLTAGFVRLLPPGAATLKEKLQWPKSDLAKLKEASTAGLHGLGHFWPNLKRRWQDGIDTRSKYSGMNTWETGMDFCQQDLLIEYLFSTSAPCSSKRK